MLCCTVHIHRDLKDGQDSLIKFLKIDYYYWIPLFTVSLYLALNDLGKITMNTYPLYCHGIDYACTLSKPLCYKAITCHLACSDLTLWVCTSLYVAIFDRACVCVCMICMDRVQSTVSYVQYICTYK